MSAPFSTLLLDQIAWDLVADAKGNIAVAAPPYAVAQDAASSVKLFQGELYYDTTQGIPYWQQILGKFPPLQIVRAAVIAAAETVPGVTAASAFFTSFTDRALGGQLQVTDVTGAVQGVDF